jgi:hypothetical protein
MDEKISLYISVFNKKNKQTVLSRSIQQLPHANGQDSNRSACLKFAWPLKNECYMYKRKVRVLDMDTQSIYMNAAQYL